MKKESHRGILKLRIVFSMTCFLFSLFFFSEKVFADVGQYGDSETISGTFSGDFIVRLGTGGSGQGNSFTFKAINPTDWENGWSGGFATLTECDNDALSESSGSGTNCNNRVRNNVTSGSISVNGEEVTITFPSSVTLNSSKYYIFAYYLGSGTYDGIKGVGSGTCYFQPSGFGCGTQVQIPYWSLNGSATGLSFGSSPVTDTRTRFTLIDPSEGETVSTTTPLVIGIEGYANESEDFPLKVVYTLFGYNNLSQLFFGNEGEWEFIVETAGNFSFSTTTSVTLNEGNYMSKAVLKDNCLDLWIVDLTCFGNVSNTSGEVATSSDWYAGEGSALGESIQNMFQGIDDIVLGGATGATTTLAYRCNPLNWEPISCVSGLMIPDMGRLVGNTANGMYNVLEDKIPFGFYTQISSKIKSKTASTTLAAADDVVISIDTIGMASTTVFSWTAAKDFMDNVIGENVMILIIWCEWILFSGYVMLRLGTKIL